MCIANDLENVPDMKWNGSRFGKSYHIPNEQANICGTFHGLGYSQRP